MEVKRIFDLLDRYSELYPNKADAFSGMEYGSWGGMSVGDYIDLSEYLAYGLLEIGIQKGDKIASITYNRPEWNLLDMALLSIGAIHVPIYNSINEDGFEHILRHAEVKYVFVSGADIYHRISNIAAGIDGLIGLYSFKDTHGYQDIHHLIEKGRQNPKEDQLNAIKASISEEDIATIVYTAGTTKQQKAVMLSHQNIVSNFTACAEILPLKHEHRAMSSLPVCDIYERILNYTYQYKGISVYYVEYIGSIAQHARRVQPQVISMVPRLLEKIYERYHTINAKQHIVKRIIFKLAIHLAMKYNEEGNSLFYRSRLYFARLFVFNKWKKRYGNRLEFIICGGSMLQTRLLKIFWAAGIPIMQGYGLTEASPVVSCNSFQPNGLKFGSVGLPLPGIELKIAEENEILCKGPNIMKGYYKDQEQSREIIDSEGWLHTGDIGYIDEKQRLFILGRKKLIFTLRSGKIIAPHKLENLIKTSPFIDNIMIIGENKR